MKIKNLLEEKGYLTEEDLFEMANVFPEDSGLQFVVFISPKGSAKYGPRVKVSNIKGKMSHTDVFSITIPENRIVGNCKLIKTDLEDITDWIKLNQNLIVSYWNYEISTKDIFNRLTNL